MTRPLAGVPLNVRPSARSADVRVLEGHTEDVDEQGVPDGVDPTPSAVRNPWKRITSVALIITALGGAALGIVLLFMRPAGERMEGPLGLLFILLVATMATLGVVTAIGDERS